MITCPVCKQLLDDMGYPQVRCPFCGTIIDTGVQSGMPPHPITPPSAEQKNAQSTRSAWPQPQYQYPLPQQPYVAPQNYGYYQGAGSISHAGLIRRGIAFIIDGMIVGSVSFIMMMFWGYPNVNSISSMATSLNRDHLIMIGLSVVITLGYFILMEGYFHRTIGKMALGIIVVGEDLRPIGWSQSAIRNGLRILYQIPVLGILIYLVDAILISMNDQRIGDKIAHTYVIKKDYFDNITRAGWYGY